MSRLQCVRNDDCRIPAQILLLIALLFGAVYLRAENAWTVVGPAGGDARALASFPGQPKHLLLGTTNSWLYESTDGGAKLASPGKAGQRRRICARQHCGGLRRPVDDLCRRVEKLHRRRIVDQPRQRPHLERAGRSSKASRCMLLRRRLPIRALSMPERWKESSARATAEQRGREISPPGSHEIHEIESLAVDPGDPDMVYAGTWHLPWKTTDGGKTWHNIKQGLIVDSDVFSIIVDPEHPHTVYLSACSGIYKSENAGTLFRKIQGIPSEARRTRSLMQDPEKRDVVYAGTTEGLYKTVNAGKTFERMTDVRCSGECGLCRSRRFESRAAGDGSRRRADKPRCGRDVCGVEPGNLGAKGRGGCSWTATIPRRSMRAW